MAPTNTRTRWAQVIMLPAVIVLLVVTYFVAYYANRDQPTIGPVRMIGVGANSSAGLTGGVVIDTRTRYRMLQGPSEIFFGPADWMDKKLQAGQFLE